jgi:pyrroline-5-carboxylate reductase
MFVRAVFAAGKSPALFSARLKHPYNAHRPELWVLVFLLEGNEMKIGIIGFGNLGRALASALINSGSVAGGDVFVCEKLPETRALAEKEPYHAHASGDVNYVISNSDVICVTVKDYVFEELSACIDRRGLVGKTVVSFMAGVTFEKIYSLIGEVSLVRAMPSLAIAELEGVIAYTRAPDEIAEIFNRFGYAFETAPETIEKVTAFSGCGLGFAAYLINAFAAAGESIGFAPEVAAHIAALTFKNASGRGDFRATIKAVATPGGATEQGVLCMDESGVYEIVAKAIRKAYERVTRDT